MQVREAMRDVGAALSRAARELPRPIHWRESGQVTRVADGVLQVSGLPSTMADELLEVRGHGLALVLGLAPNEIQAIALDDASSISVGAVVRRTGRSATVRAGDGLLGRIVDPLGRPLDGRPLPHLTREMPLERRAPQIHERGAVHMPLLTGVLAVDAMFPIGRGQRELVLGEDGAGKTSLALDVMLRQTNTDVTCVYVAVGRRRAEVWQLANALRGAHQRWVIVMAPEDASPGLRYLAPYAGTAIAEALMLRGEHALIIYDDLTSHATAWRELSLLLRRAPGREAFPGDVFYLHSRLLERAAQLSSALGGGSLTALPLARIEGDKMTGYIPTNLVSITDGQLVLSRSLMAAGVRPAIDAGLSVSRVGSKAQPQAFRSLASRLRLDYAAFLELEVFSKLGARLEASTQRRLEVGRRTRRLLQGKRLAPLRSFDEIVRLVVANEHDLVLAIAEEELEAFIDSASDQARSELSSMVERVERELVLGDDDRKALVKWLARRVRPHPESTTDVE